MSDFEARKLAAIVRGVTGAVQENAGWFFGNEWMQLEGHAVRIQADAEYREAARLAYVEGMKDSVVGRIQENIGASIGNKQLQEAGKASYARGEAKRAQNARALIHSY
ncbi:hypothetical protein DSO57_1020428 [Entomophthora muscae]|uniref:Uncharacterized protein n=1 Tax=Entomophthora muscae TaxID=34485 RepID=A0ACC2RUR8_9FUNG|nr:hypothetical protein DSO57_1020428 [Entomophthora muscae]